MAASSVLCYVLGCYDEVIISSRHKAYGMIQACRSHNPIRHAYDAPFGGDGAMHAAVNAPQTPADDSGGYKVRVPVQPIVRPPAPVMIADPF